jgi:hypothetical protein
MLTQTHFIDFNISAFKGLWKSLRGIKKHYERLTMVHEVYEEVGRYTITTPFTDETKKPEERQPREANLFIFSPTILNLGRVLNVNIHKLR